MNIWVSLTFYVRCVWIEGLVSQIKKDSVLFKIVLNHFSLIVCLALLTTAELEVPPRVQFRNIQFKLNCTSPLTKKTLFFVF